MRRIAGFALALGVVAGGGALAAEQGVYIGGSVGQAYVDYDTDNPMFPDIDLDDDDFAYKIIAGFRPLNFFAVEGGYRHLGEIDGTANMMPATSETTAFDAAGLGILPIGPVDLFAKIGIAWWDTDAILDGQDLGDSDTSTIYGVGVGLNLGKLGIRLEYEILDTDIPDDLEMLSAGLTFTF